jgi:ribosomally synthesized peptide (two-chain TOMM family)
VNMDLDRFRRFDLGVTFDDFISFAAAIFNATALGWGNEAFMRELTSYKGQEKQHRKRTITLLNEWLNYRYPWQEDLVIQIDPTAEYDPTANGGKGKWIKTTPPVLTLTIPWMSGAELAEREVAANQQNTSVSIMGLALYNTDGPGYPFTCG